MEKRHLLLLILEICFCVPIFVFGLYNSYYSGYLTNPLYYLGAIFFSLIWINAKKFLRLRDKYPILPYIPVILLISLFLIRDWISSYVFYFVQGGSLSIIPLLILGIREILVDESKLNQPPEEKLTIRGGIKSSDVLGEALNRFIVSGFGHNYVLLSKLITALSNGKRIAVYVHYEYTHGSEDFVSLGKAREADVIFWNVEGKPWKRRAACFEGSDPVFLNRLVHNYWIWRRKAGGDYLSYFLPYEGDFKAVAERIDKLLYRNNSVSALGELVRDYDFIIIAMTRDKNELRDMEIITSKFSLEDIRRRLSTVASVDV
jgi:cadmium resistance protein CadD (predicted permease)